MKFFDYETRIQVVKAYLKGNTSIRDVAKKFNISPSAVHDWVSRYKIHGEEALTQSQVMYSGDFKLYVINYMHNNHMTIAQTARIFGSFSVNALKHWNEVFMKEGEEGLLNMNPHMERMKRKRNIHSTKELENMTKEELLNENEFLRMENEYLKKLHALVQKRISQENGNEPPSSMN